MPLDNEPPPPPKGGQQVAQKKLERFVKAFEESSDSVATLKEAILTLAGILDDEKDGLITAMLEMTDEIRGLRQDLRTAAKAQGLGNLFDLLRR